MTPEESATTVEREDYDAVCAEYSKVKIECIKLRRRLVIAKEKIDRVEKLAAQHMRFRDETQVKLDEVREQLKSAGEKLKSVKSELWEANRQRDRYKAKLDSEDRFGLTVENAQLRAMIDQLKKGA